MNDFCSGWRWTWGLLISVATLSLIFCDSYGALDLFYLGYSALITSILFVSCSFINYFSLFYMFCWTTCSIFSTFPSYFDDACGSAAIVLVVC